MTKISVKQGFFKNTDSIEDTLTTAGLASCCGIAVRYQDGSFGLGHIDAKTNLQTVIGGGLEAGSKVHGPIQSCVLYPGSLDEGNPPLVEQISNYIRMNLKLGNPKIQRVDIGNNFLEVIVDKSKMGVDDTYFSTLAQSAAAKYRSSQLLHITCNVIGPKKTNEISDPPCILLRGDISSPYYLYIHPVITPPDATQITISSDYKPKDFKFCHKNEHQIYLLQDLMIDGQDISTWAKNNPDKIEILEIRLRAIADAALTGHVVLTKGETKPKVEPDSTETKLQSEGETLLKSSTPFFTNTESKSTLKKLTQQEYADIINSYKTRLIFYLSGWGWKSPEMHNLTILAKKESVSEDEVEKILGSEHRKAVFRGTESSDKSATEDIINQLGSAFRKK